MHLILYFIRVKNVVQEQMAESGALKIIGAGNLFDSKTEAIEEIYKHLDRGVCLTCKARIFRECGALPALRARVIQALTQTHSSVDALPRSDSSPVGKGAALTLAGGYG